MEKKIKSKKVIIAGAPVEAFTSSIKFEDGQIITFDGTQALKSECAKIDGKWYKIGDVTVRNSGQCYVLPWNSSPETKVRATNAQLIWDSELKRYCQKTGEHIEGLVRLVKNDEEFGFFKYTDECIPYYAKNGAALFAINFDVLKGSNAEYNPTTGKYQLNLSKKDKQMLLGTTRRDKLRYSRYPSGIYNFAEIPNIESFLRKFAEFQKNTPVSVFDRFFEDRTFGCEVETCAGSIPEHMLHELGIFPLHDGSITGHEYVTPVLTKNGMVKRIETIFDSCIENTRANEFCSLHYHIGNVRTDAEFLVAFYQLYYRLQGELDALNPLYKRDVTYFATKREGKDHCKPLPNLELNYLNTADGFAEIMALYHEGQPARFDKASGLYIHFKRDRPKWDHLGRYYALNFLPTLFEKKKTIEFRVAAGTVNKYRALNWLFIYNAMIMYCEKHENEITKSREKILLKDVLQDVYADGTEEGDFLFEYLAAYIGSVKAKNRSCYATRDLFGDYFTVDPTYSFNIGGLSPFNFK